MKKTKQTALFLLAATILSGCVSDNRVGTSSDILVLVKTSPPMSAHCLLENKSGAWDIFTTPGYADIHRSASPLSVTCHNPTGWRGHVDIDAIQDGYAYIGAIVAGGLASAAMMMVAPPVGIAAAAGTGLGIAGLTEGDNLYEDRGHKYNDIVVVPMQQLYQDYPEAIGYPADKPIPATKKSTGRHAASGNKPFEQCVTIIPISPETKKDKPKTQCDANNQNTNQNDGGSKSNGNN